MKTPFQSGHAADILHEILTLPDGASDTADLLYQYAQEFDEAYGEIDEGEETEKISEAVCIRLWIAGCLLDAVLNGMDYAAGCKGFADEYRLAVRSLENALFRTKKRLFRKAVPVHNAGKIVECIYDGLLSLTDEDCTVFGAHLSDTEWMETEAELTALNERLEPHLPIYKGGVL